MSSRHYRITASDLPLVQIRNVADTPRPTVRINGIMVPVDVCEVDFQGEHPIVSLKFRANVVSEFINFRCPRPECEEFQPHTHARLMDGSEVVEPL